METAMPTGWVRYENFLRLNTQETWQNGSFFTRAILQYTSSRIQWLLWAAVALIRWSSSLFSWFWLQLTIICSPTWKITRLVIGITVIIMLYQLSFCNEHYEGFFKKGVQGLQHQWKKRVLTTRGLMLKKIFIQLNILRVPWPVYELFCLPSYMGYSAESETERFQGESRESSLDWLT